MAKESSDLRLEKFNEDGSRMVAQRRINYLKPILSRHDSALIKKVYLDKKKNPIPKSILQFFGKMCK